MFILGEQRLVFSASDLTQFCRCEFAFARKLDEKLGREVTVPTDTNAMLLRAGRLGDAHEQRLLEHYRETTRVVEISRVDHMTSADELLAAQEQTRAALNDPQVSVVFQATFFDPHHRPAQTPEEIDIAFVGFADFVVRQPSGEWQVQDAKLARRARSTALLQLGAYAQELERLGYEVAPEAQLLLGDGCASSQSLATIVPMLRRQRLRTYRLAQARWAERGADGRRDSAPPLAWNSPGVRACGECVVCAEQIAEHRDVFAVAGLTPRQRDRLLADGIATIDQLAKLPAPPADIPPAVALRLRRQAALQCASEGERAPRVLLVDPEALRGLPQPDPGDWFFGFESDPLYSETLHDGSVAWGIDYLFGWADASGQYTGLWAHSLDEERAALLGFLDRLEAARRAYPAMHVYHYGPYEPLRLLELAARHGVAEDLVNDLFAADVFVDLYAAVRKSLCVGASSYDLKQLEPVYMGSELRDDSSKGDAADSATAYATAAQLRTGKPSDRGAAQRLLDSIADDNRYDCVSILRLRTWLLERAATHGITPRPKGAVGGGAGVATPGSATPALARLAGALEQLACDIDEGRRRAPLPATVFHLAGAAIDYYTREHRSFWSQHHARCDLPVDEWAADRGVFVVESHRVRESPPGGRYRNSRSCDLELRGQFAPGSTPKVDDSVFALFPSSTAPNEVTPGRFFTRRAKIIECDAASLVVRVDSLRGEASAAPIAVTPGPPPPAGRQREAFEAYGQQLLAHPETPSAVTELLAARPPRFRGGKTLTDVVAEVADEELATRVTHATRQLDRAVLAVQGPPGTGKTHVGARVIAELVNRHRWRIGVVAQSHAVVENLLARVCAAGVDASKVGKVPQKGRAAVDTPYTKLSSRDYLSFQEQDGYVIGGTAWSFADRHRFTPGGLDLLVVDEAGQFSLASAISSGQAAKNLLLLGDPKQLPQVTQGIHPYPVNVSTLNWLLGDRATVPETLGFFLPESWRMHPALCETVSDMMYEGRLRAAPAAQRRDLAHVCPPGVIWHPQHHTGRATDSPEEAQRVTELCRDFFARDPSLSDDDIIVVAAYNAQVERIRETLSAAGLPGVRVGTVDRFQGQEAQLGIVSLAASNAANIARGVEFLLMPNRLNVAISRAKWACHLVSSAALGDQLPDGVEGFAAVANYLRLLERATVADDGDEPSHRC